VKALLGILDSVALIAKETPAVDNSGSRFGNPAFKLFYDKVKEVSHSNSVVFATPDQSS
jgi:serine/threonine-protein phosphatase 2A activator